MPVVPRGIRSIVEEWKLRDKPWQWGTDWDPEPWIRLFPEHSSFILEQKKYNLGFLNRDLVHQILQECYQNDDFIQALLIVMIWGYSGNSTGPARTRRILDESDIARKLQNIFELLRDYETEERISNIRKAFEIVTQDIKYLGPSFGTKFLFFAGKELGFDNSSGHEILPELVIIDRRVAHAWRYWFGDEFDLNRMNGSDYCRFIEKINQAANSLEIHPEELEFILFCNPDNSTVDSNWASIQTFNEITDFETMVWGFALASELMLKNSRLFPIWTRPGGGQYNCISVYCESNSDIHFDFNLDGRIHAFLDDHYVSDWNILVRKGAYASAASWATNSALPIETDTATTPWAIALRALVSLLINDPQLKDATVTPFVVDDSVYGLQVSNHLVTKYENTLLSTARPTPLGLPPEIWLYEIVTTEGRTGLIDLCDSCITWDKGRREVLSW